MGNQTSYKKGHKISEETKLKIGKANTGRVFSAESIKKRVESRRWYKPSQETKDKIRLSNTGKKRPIEIGQRHSEIMKEKYRNGELIPWNKGKGFSIAERKDRHNIKAQEWVERNRVKRSIQSRTSSLKKNYGITIEDFDRLLATQECKCAICGGVGKEWIDSKKRIRPKLLVDHCHRGGGIRGLLCHNCNVGIGNFKDSPDLLEKAILYLKQSALLIGQIL